MDEQPYRQCIEACDACADACDNCAASCLHEADVQSMTRCIALDIDCAQVCRLAAAMMSRGSEFASLLCRDCAQICEVCAEECSRHPMEHCQRCAQACRDCASLCRHMASMPAGLQGSTGAGIAAH